MFTEINGEESEWEESACLDILDISTDVLSMEYKVSSINQKSWLREQ